MSGDWGGFVSEVKRGGWRAMLAAGVGYAFGMTVLPFYTLGAFIGPLGREFGWSRAEIQASMIFVVAGTLAGAWGTGWLIDRFGVKPVTLWSQLGLGVSLILLGLSPDHLGYWYGIWFLMTLVGLGTSPIGWTRSIAAWFDRGRGMALALGLSGVGLCPLIAPAATALMIESHGWRFAYMALGGSVLLIALPFTWLIMPRDPAAPADQGVARSDAATSSTVAEALRDIRFWLLMGSLMIAGSAVSGLVPNLVPLMVDRGISPTLAASLFGVLGIAIIVGRLVAGYALDRFWAPIVACMMLPLPALGCLVLATGASDPVVLAGCVAALGLATGAEFDLAPYLVTRYFGMARYSQIYALQWVGFTVAAGVAPSLYGYIYDVNGSYDVALYGSTAMFLIAPAMLLFLGPYPKLSAKDAA